MKTYNIRKIVTKKNIVKLMLIIGIFLMVFSITAIFLHGPFSKVFPWMDSSAFLYMGKAILNGKIIYVDIFDHKGPFMFIIQAMGMLLSERIGVWIIEVLSLLIFYFMMYKTLNLIFDRKIAWLSLLILTIFAPFYTNIGNYTETFSLSLIGISLYIFFKYLIEKERKMPIYCSGIIGITLMLTLLIRLNNAIMWVIFCPLMFFYYIFNKRYKEALKLFVGVLVGMLIAFIPFAIYFSINNAWSEFFFQYIILNLKYIGEGNRLESVIFFLKTPAMILMVIPLFLLFFKKARLELKGKYLILISIYMYFIMTFLCVVLSGYSYSHYGILLFPCFVLDFAIAIKLIYVLAKHFEKEKNIIGIVIIVDATIILLSFIFMYQNNIFYYYKNNTYVFTNENARKELFDLAEIVRSNTTEDDEILAFINYPELYLVSNRYCSSKYFQINWEAFKNVDKIVNEFLEDLKSDKTKLFIIHNNNMQEIFNDILKSEYELIVTTNDGYNVFKKIN